MKVVIDGVRIVGLRTVVPRQRHSFVEASSRWRRRRSWPPLRASTNTACGRPYCAAAFDVPLGCSGYAYGLWIAARDAGAGGGHHRLPGLGGCIRSTSSCWSICANACRIPTGKFVSDMHGFGNTSSASIPLAICHSLERAGC